MTIDSYPAIKMQKEAKAKYAKSILFLSYFFG